MAKATTKVTEEFIKDRLDGNTAVKIESGVWYSGFSKVKKAALDSKTPFVAVWSNGDLCALCKKLEKNFMTDTFKSWMKTSGCIFWFGYSGDKAEEDKSGEGKMWAKNKVLTTYPFMRFYWTDGTNVVEHTASGGEWNDGQTLTTGAKNVIEKLEKLLTDVKAKTPAKTLKVRLNPDWTKEEIEEFKAAIKENGGYCPCEEQKVPDTKCMCKNFRSKTDEGDCHCGLYNKYFA